MEEINKKIVAALKNYSSHLLDGEYSTPLKSVLDAAAYIIEDYDKNSIWLPCPIGTHIFKVTYPFKKNPKVTEFEVKNIRTIGRKHRLQFEVQAIGVPQKNWMNPDDFHLTREEAEEVLKNGLQKGYS